MDGVVSIPLQLGNKFALGGDQALALGIVAASIRAANVTSK